MFTIVCVCLLLLLCRAALAQPGFVSLELGGFEYTSLKIENVRLDIGRQEDDAYPLDLTAEEVQIAEQTFSRVRLGCDAAFIDDLLICKNGNVRLLHPALGAISGSVAFRYNLQAGLQHVTVNNLRMANGRMNASLERVASDWRLKAGFDGLELGELQPFVSLIRPIVSLDTLKGGISGTLQAEGWPMEVLQADITLSDINYAAESVIQSLSGKGHVSLVHEGNEWQGDLKLVADSGELYLVPPLPDYDNPPGFYIALHDKPLTLNTVFSYNRKDSSLVIQDMDYVHPSVLALNLAGRMQLTPEFNLEGLSLRIPETPLAEIYPVYLQPWLIDTPYNDLAVDGDIALDVGISQGDINALGLKFHQADIVDKRERFAVNDLSTNLQMTEQRQHASRLSWDSLDIYRIGLGPGAIELASQGLNIEVTKWQDVPLLDGKLRIGEFDLYEVGRPDFELHMAGAVESVSLPSLTTALDWPLLGGTLSGDFSGLSYSRGDMRMDGELLVRMFDGRVTIRDLNVRDLFGNLPVLSADVGVREIDLEQLTETFAFGKITGKVGGYIRGLKLETWRPVAFDAKLSTQDDDDTRHRISQKALNNLSQIGGGLRGALSRGFLAYFDEYSYGELGFSCRLANGFCELGGVETYEQGHYLLTPGGLLPPWVQVKLAGSVIAWDALIQGFEQIAQGEVKID